MPLTVNLPHFSEFCFFYLDDGTLGGDAEQALQDLRLVEQGAGELGLSLNHTKSEVISKDPAATGTLLAAAPNLQVTDPDSAILLGSPLGGLTASMSPSVTRWNA